MLHFVFLLILLASGLALTTSALQLSRPHTALRRRPNAHALRLRGANKLLERVLKLRQGEARFLLDDLLFHNLDVHGIAAEPLHDVLVDPGRRR